MNDRRTPRDPYLGWVLLVALLMAIPAMIQVDFSLLVYGLAVALVYGLVTAPLMMTLLMLVLLGLGAFIFLALAISGQLPV